MTKSKSTLFFIPKSQIILKLIFPWIKVNFNWFFGIKIKISFWFCHNTIKLILISTALLLLRIIIFYKGIQRKDKLLFVGKLWKKVGDLMFYANSSSYFPKLLFNKTLLIFKSLLLNLKRIFFFYPSSLNPSIKN
jgi:hypothetical protein